MSDLEEMKALYVVTTIIDNVEKIAIGTDGLPFIYLSIEAIKENKVLEYLQKWSDATGICVKLQLFAQLTVLDIIEPMQSTKIM